MGGCRTRCVATVDGHRTLLASRFVGEDFEHEPVHPAKFIRWLKRRLKGVIQSGVIGRNPETGGESTYRDMSYTERALALHTSGVAWMQPLGIRGVFEPLRK